MNAELKKQLEKTLQGFLEKNQVLKLNVEVMFAPKLMWMYYGGGGGGGEKGKKQ